MTSTDAIKELGNLLESGDYESTLNKASHWLISHPHVPEIHYLRGIAADRLGIQETAVDAFIQAISEGITLIDPFYFIAIYQARNGEFTQSAITLQQGIDLIGETKIEPSWFPKLAAFFYQIGQHARCIFWCQKELDLHPDSKNILNLIASAYSILQMPKEALETYHKVLQIDKEDPQLHFNLSVVLRQLRHLQPAMRHLEIAGSLDPKKYDPANLVLLSSSLLDFDRQEKYARDALQLIRNEDEILQPFGYFFISDSGEDIKNANELHSKAFILKNPVTLARKKFREGKIRIGYLSSDFKTHATSFLIDQLIKRHDRDAFEVFGFDFSVRDPSADRAGIELAFDEFVDVMGDSHEDTAQRIAAYDIDILVDLKGYTENCRPQILSYRPGRIQVNYLGYPGTMGNQHIDYIIGDSIVTPHTSSNLYSEHIVELPCCYQPNNPSRQPISRSGRKDHQLPKDAFVFSCFNHHWKYTRRQVLVWKKILEACPDSILWIMESVSKVNVAEALNGLGIPKSRIITAPLATPKDHLERLRHADLFLDTYPCGAHTTASDSILSGVPVLNILGEAFHTRVSGSIMAFAGGPEYICETEGEYLEKAIACYDNPALTKECKSHLLDFGQVHHPYNVETTTRSIEQAYKAMVSQGEEKRAIKIDPWWA